MKFREEDVKHVFHWVAMQRCQCCGRELNYWNRDKEAQNGWHAHHIVPIQVRVDDSRANLAILCIGCHLTCAHPHGDTRAHNPPEKWGDYLDRRRCWHKDVDGEQCLEIFTSVGDQMMCKKHR